MRRATWKNASAAVALFAVNAYIAAGLFRVEYTRQMGSIEAAYIGLARYIRDFFPDLNWFPLWYGGIPFPDAYPPLLHFLVAAFGAACHVSSGLAYHAVTATLYAAGPVALFWTARRLGAGRVAAFAGGLLYSLVSPTCWLVREVRADSGGWFGPRRLVTLVPYGEGPHLASLLFLPLAVGLLHVALERRRPVYYVGAALGMAAVVLSNWIGAFALALAVTCYLLAGSEDRDWRPRWLRAGAIGIYAYAVALPWVSPSTIATIRANAPLVGGRFEPGVGHWLMVAVFAGGMVLLAWWMKRAGVAPRIRFGALFLYGTAFIALGGCWSHLKLLPQPERYHLEMDLAFWLLVALAAGPLTAGVRARFGKRGLSLLYREAIMVAVVLAVCAPLAIRQHRRGRDLYAPVEIRSTVEYQESRWLGEHMAGKRVFAPGTIGFWMGAFSNTPMLTGGFDNGERNTILQDVIFQIYFGDRREAALAWLKAFGCDAVIGAGPQSREVYHPYAHPEKFEGWRELWRHGGDVIYEVPRGSSGLAHAVRAADLVTALPPAYDPQPLLRGYLAALEDPAMPRAEFRWLSAGAARITAPLRPEDLLSVQITWDEGWTARVNGQPRRVWGDKLGQVVVEPRCSGPCTVELTYGGAEMRAPRLVSRLALAGGLLWILLLWWKQRNSARTN